MAAHLSQVARAAEKAVQASQNRDNLIKQAHAEGHSLRAIAAAAGLSHQRVHQILRG